MFPSVRIMTMHAAERFRNLLLWTAVPAQQGLMQDLLQVCAHTDRKLPDAHLLGKLSTSGVNLSASAVANSPHARAASTRAADRQVRKEPTTKEYTCRTFSKH